MNGLSHITWALFQETAEAGFLSLPQAIKNALDTRPGRNPVNWVGEISILYRRRGEAGVEGVEIGHG